MNKPIMKKVGNTWVWAWPPPKTKQPVMRSVGNTWVWG